MPDTLLANATALAQQTASGPNFANGITKAMPHREWAMTIEQAIDAEAQAQVQAQPICMLTEHFSRACHTFVARQRPAFQNN